MTISAPQPVGIFFFRPWLGGGTTTFTAHLFKAIEAAGYAPCIFRVKERGEQKTRPFAKYDGVHYQNITYEEAKKVVRDIPTVMGSPAGTKYLIRPDLIMQLAQRGMRLVIHDPNEFSIYDHLSTRKGLRAAKLPTRPICIRPTMQKFYKNARWIPHPYMRSLTDKEADSDVYRHLNAVSVARIASVKRPKIILDANRLLPKRLRVQLKGAEYRMYTKGLEEKYGDVFQQSGKTFQFPMTFAAPVDLCAGYFWNVDMTWFPDDGGGTQYAQMEAMDAGTINVMHSDWFRYKGELKPDKHLLTVSGHEGLYQILKRSPPLPKDRAQVIRENCYRLLKAHAPKVVGEQYMEELLR
jgi:glycosyltransferase involved in cell wall biosynthesis